MAEFGKIILGVICLLLAYFYVQISKNLPPPEIDEREYWGPSALEKSKPDESIRKFKISFSQEKVEKLKQKLEDAGPFAEPLEGVAFQYGFNSNKLKDILKYWKDDYLPKWSEREKFLNSLPQFKTKIQGLDIHYIHAKPNVEKGVKVVPILLLHGWPSTIRDFYKIIPMLTKKSNESFAFEVIAPSLPGFAFSDGASRKGLASEKIAVVLRNLMLRLNFDTFYLQGGDWGGIIGSHMASLFPQNVLGFHSNFHKISTPMTYVRTIIASYLPWYFIEDRKLIKWMFPQTPHLGHLLQESGYFHLQGTKPDTIGIALENNPAGLAAYILEKFSTGTNVEFRDQMDGGLEKVFTLEELIDNLMFYYISGCMTTAVRIYKENLNHQSMQVMGRVAVTVPVAAAYFRNEFYPQFPFLLNERFKNIIHVSYFEEGGHFASVEVPDVLYQDIVNFVAKTL